MLVLPRDISGAGPMKLSVISRLYAGYVILTLVIVGIGALTYAGQQRLRDYMGELEAAADRAVKMAASATAVTDAQVETLAYRHAPNGATAAKAKQALADAATIIDEAVAALDGDKAENATALQGEMGVYRAAFDQVVLFKAEQAKLIAAAVASASEQVESLTSIKARAERAAQVGLSKNTHAPIALGEEARGLIEEYAQGGPASNVGLAREKAVEASSAISGMGMFIADEHREDLTKAMAAAQALVEALDGVAEKSRAVSAIVSEKLDVSGPTLLKGFAALSSSIAEEEKAASAVGLAKVDAMKLNVLIAAVAALVLGALSAFFIGRSISTPLRQLSDAVAATARGETAEIPGVDRADEFGGLAKAIVATDEVRREAQRLSLGMNTSETMVMIADADSKIVYLNASLQRMFRENVSEIQSVVPKFDPAAIIGAHIDVFHKDPEHQRALLSDLDEMRRAKLAFGAIRLDLAVSPIRDEAGDRIGTIVEWRDVTAELRATSEIDAVVAAAVDGDFSRRADLDGAPEVLRRMGERVNAVAEAVDAGVAETRRVALLMSEGDLSQTMQGDFKGAFADLKEAVNSTVARMANLVGDIQSAVSSMQGATDEIANGAGQLSSRAESQASSLQETVATMETITGTIKTNAENAEQAGGMSQEAASRAERGGKVVEETVTAMSEIESGSSKISDIISVIDSIAFQTNLLALNAAVEAARAGDAGKGFAVVASEVRTLAQRSADAARDIKELIVANSTQVSQGVELVNRTGDALKEIIESVDKVAGTIDEIANASREQSAGVQEISTSIGHLDQITQQNSAMAEQSAASARALAGEGERLADMVAFFKVSASAKAEAAADAAWVQASAAASPRPAPSADAPKPAEKASRPVAKAPAAPKPAIPAPAPKSAAPVSVAPANAAQASAAPVSVAAPAIEASGEEWEDF